MLVGVQKEARVGSSESAVRARRPVFHPAEVWVLVEAVHVEREALGSCGAVVIGAAFILEYSVRSLVGNVIGDSHYNRRLVDTTRSGS